MSHKNAHLEEYCWCDQCKEERRVANEAAKQKMDAEVIKGINKAVCATSHQYCQKCGHCIDCGDCARWGCGEGVVFSETYVTAEAFRALKEDYEDATKELVRLRRQVEQQGFTIVALHNDYAACIGQRDQAMARVHYLRGQVKRLEEYLGE